MYSKIVRDVLIVKESEKIWNIWEYIYNNKKRYKNKIMCVF